MMQLVHKVVPKMWGRRLNVMILLSFCWVLKKVYDRIQAYLVLSPSPLQETDPMFAITACYDRAGNVVTEPGEVANDAGDLLHCYKKDCC